MVSRYWNNTCGTLWHGHAIKFIAACSYGIIIGFYGSVQRLGKPGTSSSLAKPGAATLSWQQASPRHIVKDNASLELSARASAELLTAELAAVNAASTKVCSCPALCFAAASVEVLAKVRYIDSCFLGMICGVYIEKIQKDCAHKKAIDADWCVRIVFLNHLVFNA